MKFRDKLVKLSDIENEIIFIQFESILLNFIQMFANVRSNLLETAISSTNDEQQVNWNCSKPLA